MYSICLFPVIIKPSTSGTAPLVDNIIVNTVDIDTVSGLINDITDHLPIFAAFPFFYETENHN